MGKLTLNCTATSGPEYVKALYNFYDEVVSHIRSLSNLGIRDQLMGVCISPIILSKLPHSFRLEWYKSQELDSNLTGNLGELLKFIKRRISSLEKAAQISSDQNTDKTFKVEVKDKSDKSFRRKPKQKANCVLQTQSVKGQTGEKPKCLFCHKNGHDIDSCISFLKLSIDERNSKVRELIICSKCLKKAHSFAACAYTCSKCTGSHNALLCRSIRNNPYQNTNNELFGQDRTPSNPFG